MVARLVWSLEERLVHLGVSEHGCGDFDPVPYAQVLVLWSSSLELELLHARRGGLHLQVDEEIGRRWRHGVVDTVVPAYPIVEGAKVKWGI